MKTIKIDECIRRIRSYAMQFEAEGKKNISEDLWVAVDFLKQQTTMCFDCTRRRWYMKGYQDGLNADKWIPCEVEMPKDETLMYWTTHEDGSIIMHGYLKRNGFIYNWEVDDLEKRKRQGNVVAWMPIFKPQPYKKEGAENE